MNLTALNDLHIGAIRSAGTRPDTAYKLRQDLLGQLVHTLDSIETDLLFNGDLFDGPNIPQADLLRTFQILARWLGSNNRIIYLSNGNHDLSKNSTILSSFQLLAKLLLDVHGPGRVVHIETGTSLPDHNAYVIPHVANQALFDVELERVPACDYLFLHANYDNGFAVESDHSLNVSKEQAEACPAKFIVFGHEHQARTELGGKVIVVGNQFPSSVSDCLNNDEKFMFQLVDDTHHLPVTWAAEGDYSEQDWRSLEDRGRFIRVTGTAGADEGGQVVQALARFRQQAKALVITNAVKVAGVADQADLQLTQEAITSFDVQAALMELLTPEEGAKILALLNPTPG